MDLLLGKSHHHHHDEALSEPKKNTTRESLDKKLNDGALDGAPMCCNDDPVTQLDNVQKMASVIGHEVEDAAKEATGEVEPEQTAQSEKNDEKKEIQEGEVVDEENVVVINEEENKNLHKMGLNTAIAIALHNFPEGEKNMITYNSSSKVWFGGGKRFLTHLLSSIRKNRTCNIRSHTPRSKGWRSPCDCHRHSQHPGRTLRFTSHLLLNGQSNQRIFVGSIIRGF